MFNFFKKKETKQAECFNENIVKDELYARVRVLMFEGKNDEAEMLLKEGAAQGLPKCQYYLGAMIERGVFLSETAWEDLLKQAYPQIDALAKNGDAEALLIMYYYYKNSYRIKMDPQNATKKNFLNELFQVNPVNDFLIPAVEKGYYLAQYAWGQELYQNDQEEEAYNYYTLAANQLPALQFLLASMYSEGEGVEKDEEKALCMMQKAAEKGECRAQLVMASYYANGTYVQKDFNKAKELAAKSWEQGHQPAKDLLKDIENLEKIERETSKIDPLSILKQVNGQSEISENLARGDLEGYKSAFEQMEWMISQNFMYTSLYEKTMQKCSYKIGVLTEESSEDIEVQQEAFAWYKKALDFGNKEAAYHLATMYYDGRGTEKNYAAAIRLFRECIESGLNVGKSFYYLGNCYHFGYFYDKDNKKAKEYYQKAIEYGFSCQTALIQNAYEDSNFRDDESLANYVKKLNDVVEDVKKSGGLIEKDLRLKFGESWDSLSKDAQYSLITGIDQYYKIVYIDDREEECKDYSQVIVGIIKALEITLKQIILIDYMSYLQNKGISIESVPGLSRFIFWDKNNVAHYPYPDRINNFTLGSAKHVFEVGEAYDVRRSVLVQGERYTVGEHILDYFDKRCADDAFPTQNRKREIAKYLKELSDELSVIVRLRNRAAHTNVMSRVDAEVCADCIILVKKLLIILLKKIEK